MQYIKLNLPTSDYYDAEIYTNKSQQRFLPPIIGKYNAGILGKLEKRRRRRRRRRIYVKIELAVHPLILFLSWFREFTFGKKETITIIK